MSPIRLSDSELDAVLAAARPLAVEDRDAFLRQVAEALQRCRELGPGSVYRAIAETQRAFIDPPDLSGGVGKYDVPHAIERALYIGRLTAPALEIHANSIGFWIYHQKQGYIVRSLQMPHLLLFPTFRAAPSAIQIDFMACIRVLLFFQNPGYQAHWVS